MKHSAFNQAFMKLFTLITLCFIAFGFTGNLGLDTYEVYLNDKLILKHSVNQPLSLRTLQLDKATADDQLRIIYTHCMVKGAGTDRSLAIKNEKGTMLKKWDFANASGSNLSMTIPVKELLKIEKANADHDLRLYYAARELPKGEMLALIQTDQKSIAGNK
ncbi:MAG TPA: hypothetical protein VK541_03315 [Pedobacter sp.]|uniref:hypothetical protein n=1 Tax=Pedobacter sp. TaxID=1411316 RepID=UPI002C50B79D|nr:hypothetical protein [Pedobacter sp.]HMI01481.1 hypothetical protein [Pedobacter sp.]